jgi:hypothetical protein
VAVADRGTRVCGPEVEILGSVGVIESDAIAGRNLDRFLVEYEAAHTITSDWRERAETLLPPT